MFIRNCKRVYEVNELLHYLSENKNYVNLKSMLLKLCSVSRKQNKKLCDCEFFVNINNCPVLQSNFIIQTNLLQRTDEIYYEGQSIKYIDPTKKIHNAIIEKIYKDRENSYYVIKMIEDGKIVLKTIQKTVEDSNNFTEDDKQRHVPVLSFYKDSQNHYYSDILIPTISDWMISTNKVFPLGCKTNKNNILNEQEIEDVKYDSTSYTKETAPDEFKYKFDYYFGKFPKSLFKK